MEGIIHHFDTIKHTDNTYNTMTQWQYCGNIKHTDNTYIILSNTLTILTMLYQTHFQYLPYSIKHTDNIYNTLSSTVTIFAILFPPHWHYLQYSIKYSDEWQCLQYSIKHTDNTYNSWHSIKRNDSILLTSNTVTILTIFTKYKTQYSQSKPHYLDLFCRFTDKSLKLTKNDLPYFCGHGDKYTVQ